MDDKPNILAFFAKEAWRYKKLVIAIIIILPVTVVLERYITPLLVGYVLNHLQADDITLQNSWWVITLFFTIELVSQVVGYRVVLWMMWTVQVRGEANLYRQAYDKLSRHSLSFYSDTFTGSLVSKVGRFTSAYMEFVNTATYQVLVLLTVVLATIIGLFFLIWQYAIVLLILTILFIIAAFFGTRFMRQRFKERSQAYTEISGKLSDSISNMMAVKTDAKEDDERKLLNVSIENMVDKESFARKGMVSVTSIYSFITTLMKVGALIAAIWSVQAGFGSAAIIYISLTYTFNLIGEIFNVNGLLRSYYQITGDTADTLAIIQQPIAVVDKTNKKLVVNKPDISFENVSFTHPDNDPETSVDPLFRDFSLHIKTNQKIGLVGASGSGKSTLLKLLMRFYDINAGKILIGGQAIDRVTQQSLHENIAYVPQEPLLFHRSVLENISYSRPSATLKEVRKAAEQANALEFIEKLPKGFDTLVGERGVKLSGGQRQRVAIARAILKDAPILILDEATSALDSESEHLIQEALSQLMKGRTSIVIAHRLSTIAKLDRVIVLDDGAIVEEGSHEELLHKKGAYAKLWARQSGGFIEEGEEN
ncbi:MAG: MdlB, multidrug/protein/lipid transporter ATPase, ATP-binding cassette, subfamily bacterial [Candidatus Saccharibacteria bacterium]|nr:MdlB, multidrug/protein/lipid transporter ATPase, ATP-binding cassette, subfamily bacterial [Candidatus Saccharibacteria bacterium]